MVGELSEPRIHSGCISLRIHVVWYGPGWLRHLGNPLRTVVWRHASSGESETENKVQLRDEDRVNPGF